MDLLSSQNEHAAAPMPWGNLTKRTPRHPGCERNIGKECSRSNCAYSSQRRESTPVRQMRSNINRHLLGAISWTRYRTTETDPIHRLNAVSSDSSCFLID